MLKLATKLKKAFPNNKNAESYKYTDQNGDPQKHKPIKWVYINKSISKQVWKVISPVASKQLPDNTHLAERGGELWQHIINHVNLFNQDDISTYTFDRLHPKANANHKVATDQILNLLKRY